MANTIDILKNTRVATSTNEVTNASEAQVIKDKPSLFDSLLSNNGNKDTKIIEEPKLENKQEATKTPEQELVKDDIEPSKEVTIQKGENKTEDSLKDKVNNKIEIKTEENTADKIKSTGSLLDRMVFEVKKDIKISNEEEAKKINNKIDTQPVLGLEVEKDMKILSKEESNNINIKIDTQSLIGLEVKENANEKGKSISSLPSEEVLEVKKDIKISSEENIKEINNKTNIQTVINSEVLEVQEQVKSEENKEIITPKNENKIVDSLIDKINNKVEINTEENTNEETKSSGSLLDRMILEVKKDIKVSAAVEKEVVVTPENENKIVDSVIIEKQVETVVGKVEEKIETEEIIKNPQVSLVAKLSPEISTEIIIKNQNEIENPLANISKNQNSDTNLEVKIDTPLNVLNDSRYSKNDVKISLMDQLILKNSVNLNEIPLEEANIDQKDSISKDFISNIYLSSQRSSISTQELFNKNEAINLLKDAKSLNDVKTSAGMLGLDLENIEVNIEQNLEINTKIDLSKKSDMDLLLRKNIINNLMYEKNIISEDVKNLITKSVEASNALIENSLELADDAIVTVNSPLAYNIQSKIIGARQQMSTMMSDIAKQMYENYKPPVTVFKINLNPLELGSIAILMKSDKNNALTISMNVSNNTTLEALIENQNVLRNSLNKNFDESTKFNLDFSSSNQNNNQSNNQSGNQKNSNNFEQKMDTQSILQLKEENKDKEEKSTDYM